MTLNDPKYWVMDLSLKGHGDSRYTYIYIYIIHIYIYIHIDLSERRFYGGGVRQTNH